MDYPDSASLQAAMEVPVTATLGCTGPLLQKLQSLMASKHSWPEGVNEIEIQRLKRDLEVLCISLKDLSEAEDSSFMAKCWMNEVRELCFDTEDHLDEFMNSGAGAHEIANGFSGLVARAVDATERRTLLNLAAKAIKTLLPGEAGARRLTPTSVHAGAGGHGLVGVGVHMDNIINLVSSAQKKLKVVPIFGCSGLGKTTVARSVYHQLQHSEKFQCRAFVRVSRDPDMRKLLTSILSQIKAPWTGGYPDAQDLIVRINKHLQGKRYFIVIDDVWTASVWDIISRAFPDGDYFSRIVTTTEIYDVALACCRYCSDGIYEMRLNDDQARKLFSGRVFGSEHGCPPEFEAVSAEIIRKCGGLPLAITNITNLLPSGLPLDKWKLILDSLPSTLSTNPSEMMKEVLNLVYNDLPPHLKTSLLYLSTYPEGYTIEKNDLARQFVAEGFVRAMEGRDLEETAKGYIDELVSNGVIQSVDTNYDGEVLSCTVHHIVLDFIRYRAKVENFIITVDHLQSSLALPDKVRRLSIQFGGAKSADIPESMVVSQVRSLTFCGFVECVPPVAAYGLLRVLVLHIWADQGKGNFDLSRIAELFRLKYLQIQCNLTVKLPDKIQGLQSLETLEVDARLSAVPSDIGHLEKLEHLRLPAEANVSGPGNKKCMDSILFENLSNLKSVVLALASSSEKNALNAASASSMSLSDGFSMVSSPPPLLQRLELSWRCFIFSNLPQWTKELTKLCILKIAVGELLVHDIDLLGELPSLTALSLYVQTTPAEWIVFGKAGFSVLKYFKFRCSVPLLKFEVDTMPNLQKLKLVFNGPAVDKHGTAPMGIEHLSSLEEISAKIGGAVADAESTLRTAVSKHPSNPRIIVQLLDHILYSSPSMGTKNKEHIAQDENKVEDEKKQADIRISAFPESSSSVPISEAVADANKAIELDPSMHKAYLRKGSACIKLEEYQTAKAALEVGSSYAPGDSRFTRLMKECDDRIAEEASQVPVKSAAAAVAPAAPSGATTVATAAEDKEDGASMESAQPTVEVPIKPKYRHDYYNSTAEVVLTIFAKGVPADSVVVDFGEQMLSVSIDLPGEEPYHFQPRLFSKIIPEKCKYVVLSTKVEIRLAKAEPVIWTSLDYKGKPKAPQKINVPAESAQRPSYPSSKSKKDWDKLEAEVKKQEKDEILDGDAALKKFFREIYSDADEDMRRAMMKSFVESNGTVLPTNWKDVGKKPVEGSPPDGMELKKWEY